MSEWFAGIAGLTVGLVVNPVLKAIEEPQWAREVLKNISILRVMGDGSEWPLFFEFVGAGGWGTTLSSDYIGWRNTGAGKGDSDAWLTIYMKPDGVPGFHVYGGGLIVSYKGMLLESRMGEYLHIL